MKRYLLFGLVVLAVCSPLAFVALLLTASQVPATDRVTLKLPDGLRSTVAAAILSGKQYRLKQKDFERVIRLEPNNATAWGRLCSFAVWPKVQPTALATCKRAAELDESSTSEANLARALEAAGDFCTAEDAYTYAHRGMAVGDVDNLRGMGRSALQCGRIPASIAELEAARDLDLKSAAKPGDDDDEDDYKANLQLDREWLVLAYTSAKRPTEAAASCSQAHPEWKSCTCVLKDAKPVCNGK
jgi:tetratricopeptide (TPR) repeat protein